MFNVEMNISRKRRIRFIIDDNDDDDEHMNKNDENINEDMVSSRSHSIDGDDLILVILLRLPPIAVHRFLRVCKQWYTLISNPDFLRTHSSPSSPFQLHNNSTTPNEHEHDHDQLLVFYHFRVYEIVPRVGFVPLTQFQEQEQEQVEDHHHPNSSLIKLCHGFSPPGDDYNLIDTFNGLFLFHNNINIGGTYSICNPITKHFIKVPDIPKLEEGYLVFSTQANLVFDKNHPATINLSYKIIKLILRVGDIDPLHWQIYVYSSQTDSWRLLSTIIPYPPIRRFKSVYSSLTDSWRLLSLNEDFNMIYHFGERGLISLLLNGVLYWTFWISNEDVSVCFDVEKECVWFLPLPPKPENSLRNCLYFGECGGRIRLIEKFLDTSEPGWENGCYILPCDFDIMEMESQQQQQQQQQQQDGVSGAWTVKYHVNITRVFDLFSEERATVIHCYKTKSRQRNKEEEEEVLLLKLNDGSIFSFNLTSNKIIKKIVNPERTQVYDFKDVFAFTPTLYPVS